ncbi:helix-turn-helix transcriptional regulator [Pendulispora brunnea]|uniref:Helix-turn-helix transcriptional regulator n=1 Tax=Pendulispora brunnea TaxID=2905690 RepID=A0ABZ2KKW2_9BACT
MQSDIRRDILLALRHAVRAPIAFCFAASAESEGHVEGLHSVDGSFTELPNQCPQALADTFRFPIAFAYTTSRYCIAATTLAESPTFLEGAYPLVPSNGNALLLYLRLGDSLFGMAGLARRSDDVRFDDNDVQHLEQIGPALSSLTMLHTHVLHLRRERSLHVPPPPQTQTHLQVPVQTIPTSLSEREQQVARLLADGYSCVNTAAVLNLSENTVRTYVRRLYRKLDVTNRVDLVQRLIISPVSPATG